MSKIDINLLNCRLVKLQLFVLAIGLIGTIVFSVLRIANIVDWVAIVVLLPFNAGLWIVIFFNGIDLLQRLRNK